MYQTLLLIWSLYVMALTLVMVLKKVERAQRIHDLPMGPRSIYIPKSLAWKLMTLPAIPSILFFYAAAGGFTQHAWTSSSTAFIGLYCLHYAYRSIVYPRRIRTSEQSYSLISVVMTWSYYIPMGYFLGTHFAVAGPMEWHLSGSVALIGLAIFLVGLVSTIVHDEILIRLREKPSTEYAIPMRGLFCYTSNAHYFSEVVEWLGFALMTLNLPALVHLLAVFTLMVPQALRTHWWYQDYFGERYPGNRTAFFPFLF